MILGSLQPASAVQSMVSMWSDMRWPNLSSSLGSFGLGLFVRSMVSAEERMLGSEGSGSLRERSWNCLASLWGPAAEEVERERGEKRTRRPAAEVDDRQAKGEEAAATGEKPWRRGRAGEPSDGCSHDERWCFESASAGALRCGVRSAEVSVNAGPAEGEEEGRGAGNQ